MVSNKEIKERLKALRLGKNSNKNIESNIESDPERAEFKINSKSDVDELLKHDHSLFYKKEYLEALLHYERYIKVVPRKKRVWFYIGECYYALGDNENAVKSYNRFLRFLKYISSVNSNFKDRNQRMAQKKKEKARLKGNIFSEEKLYLENEKIALEKRFKAQEQVNKKNDEKLKEEREKAIKIELKEREKKIERKKKLEGKKNELISSGTYIYIEKFIKRFGNKCKGTDILKLQDLLKYKGNQIEYKDLNDLITEIIEIESFKRFKNSITYNNPDTLEEYVKNLFELYGNNYKEHIPRFEMILEEDNIQFYKGQIDSIITELTRKVKIERFERELMASDQPGSPFISIEDLDGLNGYQFEYFLKSLSIVWVMMSKTRHYQGTKGRT